VARETLNKDGVLTGDPVELLDAERGKLHKLWKGSEVEESNEDCKEEKVKWTEADEMRKIEPEDVNYTFDTKPPTLLPECTRDTSH
jgi:hypothetical protein